jgi:hypothetical protein
LTSLPDVSPASCWPPGSVRCAVSTGSCKGAWPAPVVYLHCNDLRSEHRFTHKSRANHRLETGPPLNERTVCGERRSFPNAATFDRLVQKLTLKLYPGWSKGTLSVASSEQRSQNRISLPEETVHQNLATPYKRRSSVSRMPRRKASFVVSSKTILVDLPDCQMAVTKCLNLPQQVNAQEFSTFFSESDFVRSTSGSRVPTWPAAKAWTPTQSTSAACVPFSTRATVLRPVRFHGRLPPRGVAVMLALTREFAHPSTCRGSSWLPATCDDTPSGLPQRLVSPP